MRSSARRIVASTTSDEVVTDVALVRRLLAAQFRHWAVLAIEPVPSAGTDNALFRVGDDVVVRLPRGARSAAALAKERLWLPRLASDLPLAVPLPLAEGAPVDGYPFTWAVYRWLPGGDATSRPVADERELARELARFIRSLQAIDATGAPMPGEHNVFRGEPLERRDIGTRAAIARLSDSIDVDAVTSAWESALRATEWTQPPVWIHGDLDRRNILVEHGRLSAVIDWGCLGAGDPACDVAVAWKALSAEQRPVFRDALSVDDATWSRASGWALWQALGALSYYTLETNPPLVVESRRWLAEVLADSGG